MLMKSSLLLAAAGLSMALNCGSAMAQEYYDNDCHDNNAAAGTVVGAIAGGLIGNQFGHGGGRVAATVGGAVVGGVVGNKIAGDMDCDDRHYAFDAYYHALDGNIGQRYEWRNPEGDYGYLIPTREYREDDGRWCRDFEEGVYRHGDWHTRNGTACHYDDGWRFM